ncbi:hypothetical protein CXB51_001401 [Gossypium anomalum]|uniref:Secreted protein n=1 Tax=Gossypium anomalum TaxID=47600 RepID=A0A8J6DF05_9ROSI|nr:hypothetical protein CXB51_001401 [Gossypium anomalum]
MLFSLTLSRVVVRWTMGLLSCSWCMRCRHVGHDLNKVANRLLRIGSAKLNDLHVFRMPPSSIRPLLALYECVLFCLKS